MGTHSSVLAWRIPQTEEPGGTAVHGVAESDTMELHTHTQPQITKEEKFSSEKQ